MDGRWIFNTVSGLVMAFATTFACGQSSVVCDKNHYILRAPGDCTFPTAESARKATNRWMPIGPDGANVLALIADKRTPTTVFAGTAGAGVLRSLDGGEHWNAINRGLPTLYVSAVAIDPNAAATLYAGTDMGVFKSTDGGETWSAAKTGMEESERRPNVYGLSVVPGSPPTIYAVTYDGIYKSVDGAANWAAFGNRHPGHPRFITVDTVSPETAYVGVYENSVFKTTDAGTTWTSIREALDGFDFYSWPSISNLVVDPQSPRHLYLSTQEGVVISDDGGTSWSSASGSSQFCQQAVPCDSGLKLRGLDISALATAPGSPATIYAATRDGTVFQSSDRGQHWTAGVPATSAWSDVNVLAATGLIPGEIYVGGGNGIFRSRDGAMNWRRLTLGVNAIPAGTLAVDPSTPSTIYIGFSGRVTKTIDDGRSWTAASAGLTRDGGWIQSILIDPLSPSTLFARGTGLFKSSDAGFSWNSIGFRTGYVTAIAIGSRPVFTLYVYSSAAAGGLFKSVDGGASWTRRNNQFTGNYRADIGDYIFTLAVDPGNADIVYAATLLDVTMSRETSTIFKSTDGGGHWQQLSIVTPPGSLIRWIEIDPATPGTLYAGYDDFRSPGVGIYRSVDGGETWLPPDALLPASGLSRLVIDPALSSRVYAATTAGVFTSADSGSGWKPLNAGLTSHQVNDLSLDQSGSLLRAATAGGLFEYRLGPQPAGTVAVIEYQDAGRRQFLMTASPGEIASLDAGTSTGWVRTGHQFYAYAEHAPDSVPVCRFVSTAFGPRASHFYTPFADECAALRGNPDWALVSPDAFEVDQPNSDGACLAGTIPVYRLYNSGQDGAPNHRFTTDRTVATQMIAQGWVQEGGTNLCVPF
jgi:photosystem II stability/assembly factor-like uncharacterized protein